MSRACALLMVLLLAPPVQASPDAAALQNAKENYERGSALYSARRYDEAAQHFEAAYVLVQDPALLFNIAQSHRNANQLEQALEAYRNFLRRVPDSPKRAEVEKRIAELEPLVDATKLASKPLPPPSTSGIGARDDRFATIARTQMSAGFSVLGAGVLLGIVGGGLYGGARAAQSELLDTFYQPELERRRDLMQNLAIGFVVVGGAACIAGITVGALGVVNRGAAIPPPAAPTAGLRRSDLRAW